MSNIEEDIKTMHKIISFYRDLDIINNNDKCEEIKAIENILTEREADKKIIKELEEKNTIYELNGNNVKLEIYIKDNYILKPKIKDVIEEYKTRLEKSNLKAENKRYFNELGIYYLLNKIEKRLLEDK